MKSKQLMSLLLILFLPISANSQVVLSSMVEADILQQGDLVFYPYLLGGLNYNSFIDIDRDLSFLTKSDLAVRLGLSDFSLGYEYFQDLDLRYRHDFWSLSPYLKFRGTQFSKALASTPDIWENLFIFFISYDTFTSSFFFDPQLSWFKDEAQQEKLYFQGDTGISFQSSAISFTTLKVSGKSNLLTDQSLSSMGFEIENEILSTFDWLFGLSLNLNFSKYSEIRLNKVIYPDKNFEIGVTNKLTTAINNLIWQINLPFVYHKKYHAAVKENEVLSQDEWIIQMEPKISLDIPVQDKQSINLALESAVSLSNSDILNHQDLTLSIKYQYQF